MSERPGVEVLADLADEGAVGREFEKLRGGGEKGVPRGVAARQDENVAPGIHRDAGDFAEIHVFRQLEDVRHRLERDDRHRLLREELRAEQQERCGDPLLHGGSPYLNVCCMNQSAIASPVQCTTPGLPSTWA